MIVAAFTLHLHLQEKCFITANIRIDGAEFRELKCAQQTVHYDNGEMLI